MGLLRSVPPHEVVQIQAARSCSGSQRTGVRIWHKCQILAPSFIWPWPAHRPTRDPSSPCPSCHRMPPSHFPLPPCASLTGQCELTPFCQSEGWIGPPWAGTRPCASLVDPNMQTCLMEHLQHSWPVQSQDCALCYIVGLCE